MNKRWLRDPKKQMRLSNFRFFLLVYSQMEEYAGTERLNLKKQNKNLYFILFFFLIFLHSFKNIKYFYEILITFKLFF